MDKNRILKWILCTVGVLVVGFLIYIRFASSHIQFDSQRWKNVSLYGTDNTRYRMHEDLIAKYRLIGMTKDEIINLLGPQSDAAYFKDWDLRYWMGPEPGPFGIDSVWLIIKLRDNKVVEYKIVTD